MATAGEIVTSALGEGGIDATAAEGLAWLNDRYKRMVGEAKWRRLERDLGPTVASQARYAIAADVVDVLKLRVATSSGYKLISLDELWGLESGDLRRRGRGGFFCNVYAASSEAEAVALFPTPATGGQSITALCAVLPPTLLVGETPLIPEDFHMSGLKAGVVAEGLSLIDEANADASYWEQQFVNATERLRIRRVSRVGSGPARIRVGR